MSKIGWMMMAAGVMGTFTGFASQDIDNNGELDVKGVVLNADTKKPLGKVNVILYQDSRKEKTVQTKEDGTFQLDDLKPGTYKVVFEKNGFRKVIKEKLELKVQEFDRVNPKAVSSPTLMIQMPEKEGESLMPPSLLDLFG
jgi:5-hydroxyisourate hydrolase-like protein (transthyretin family)